MLEDYDCIRYVMIDLSKAFTTDDHVILLNKLAQLKLPLC